MALSGKNVKLQPSDDQNTFLLVPLEAANMSATIKNMLDDLGDDVGEGAIPLHNVTTKILKKVLEYCSHALENPVKPEEKVSETTTEWEVKFCGVDQATLFELILAANYLDIKPLLDLTCKSVASMIKGKTPEEIRVTFNIVNDFTPGEEEKVRKENEWCEER